jgi:hypothetical protein
MVFTPPSVVNLFRRNKTAQVALCYHFFTAINAATCFKVEPMGTPVAYPASFEGYSRGLGELSVGDCRVRKGLRLSSTSPILPKSPPEILSWFPTTSCDNFVYAQIIPYNFVTHLS